MVSVSCFLIIYYNMITGWALYYLVMSLRAVLPWACCEPPWATEKCVSFAAKTGLVCSGSDVVYNQSARAVASNGQSAMEKVQFAAEDYFHNQVLGLSDGLDDAGGLQWAQVIALLAAWLIVFGVLMKGKIQ